MEIEDYRVVDGKTHQHPDQVVLSVSEDNGDIDDNYMLSRDKRKIISLVGNCFTSDCPLVPC